MSPQQSQSTNAREAQVWAALEHVSDPELDESVVELGFVTTVETDGEGGVDIGFRLPTYWCAANFAFLMADDMRRAAKALPWVTRVAVRLGEHMNDAQINHGIAHGMSFDQTFGEEASGNSLEEVRQIFAVKAFQRRQEKLLRHLLEAGHPDDQLVSLSIAQLDALRLNADGQALRARYLDRRGVVASDAPGPDATAFVDQSGVAVPTAALPGHLRSLRRVSVNTDFNGALCRGLLATRYGADAPDPGVQPIHFVRSQASLAG